MGNNFSAAVQKHIERNVGGQLETKEHLALMEGFDCDNLPDYEKEFYKRVEETYPINIPCKIKHTPYTGVICGYNRLPIQALYNGLRYPIKMQITGISDKTSKHTGAVGKIYSYGLEQVQLIEIETEKE